MLPDLLSQGWSFELLLEIPTQKEPQKFWELAQPEGEITHF